MSLNQVTSLGQYNPSLSTPLDPGRTLALQLDSSGNLKTTTSVTFTTAGTVSPGTAASQSNLIGIQYNTSAPAPTNGQQMAVQADAAGSLLVNTEGRKATYRAAFRLVPPAATGDLATIYGSSTKIVKITKIGITARNNSASSQWDLDIFKYSSTPSGGSSTGLTAVPLNSNFGASTVTNLKSWSTLPTSGTAIGSIAEQMIQFPASNANDIPTFEFNFGGTGASPIVLNNTNEGASVHAATNAPTGTAIGVYIEWTEE